MVITSLDAIAKCGSSIGVGVTLEKLKPLIYTVLIHCYLPVSVRLLGFHRLAVNCVILSFET
jgi:hypothetical protein